MMRTEKSQHAYLPIFVLIVLFVFGVAICGTYIYAANRYCPLEGGASHGWIVKFACEAKAADVALVFFTYCLVVVTGWLSWATLKLWRAGEEQIIVAAKSANAAELNARAYVALQLPIIKITPANLSHGDGLRDGENFEECGVPHVIFTNLGVTRAFLVELLYGWTVGDTLPKEPNYIYLDGFDPIYILEPNPNTTPMKRLTMALPLKPGQWSKICAGNYLWFYCSLRYEDFMGGMRTHSSCWCWSYVGMGTDWRPDSTPAYNRKM